MLCLQLIAAQGIFLQVGLKKVEEMGTEESDEFETEGSDLGDGRSESKTRLCCWPKS